jgi:hypothetical protein
VTNDVYRDIRRRYRESAELDPRLARELRQIASRLVRFGGLPSAYAPYGVWDREAEDEVFQSWYGGRLVNAGQLQALLDRAATIQGFRRLGERSLRQYVLNQRERSQVQNLYARTAELLIEDDDFAAFVEAARPQDVWWGLTIWSDPPQFNASEGGLYASAWSLGEFEIIRYRTDAKKLAPVLAAAELKRFVVGLFEAVASLLTLSLLARTFEQRFDLGAVQLDSLDSDEAPEVAAGKEADPLELEQTSLAIVAELNQRQAEVLIGTDADETQEAMAERLRCAVGTIINEQRRIGSIIDRHAESSDQRGILLRTVLDLLHEGGEQP